MLTEHQHQALVVAQLRALGILYCSIPNEGQRSARTSARFLQRGLVAGMPDLLVLTPPPACPTARGVAVEFKSARGRVAPEQAAVHAKLLEIGWVVLVGTSADVLPGLRELGYPVTVLGPAEDEAA